MVPDLSVIEVLEASALAGKEVYSVDLHGCHIDESCHVSRLYSRHISELSHLNYLLDYHERWCRIGCVSSGGIGLSGAIACGVSA